ncbi:hypothetical protein AGMMS50256_04100 [Betaproteobacteria bacterium]|nr:hypothetical protein AGMMS50256_04100 [Betaproteobacteria bacterium]
MRQPRQTVINDPHCQSERYWGCPGFPLARLRRSIPDPRIMALLEKIIDSYHAAPGKGSYHVG